MYMYTEVQQIWSYIDIEITCLKELPVTLEIIRIHMVQDSVSILWYVVARKLCVVVDCEVNIWTCTLSYNKWHLTLLCLSYPFGTILTIFATFKYLINWQ